MLYSDKVKKRLTQSKWDEYKEFMQLKINICYQIIEFGTNNDIHDFTLIKIYQKVISQHIQNMQSDFTLLQEMVKNNKKNARKENEKIIELSGFDNLYKLYRFRFFSYYDGLAVLFADNKDIGSLD